jgi:hypothetical protein
MFESGPGGEFNTYKGDKTGTIYRIDLNQIRYLKRKMADILEIAIQNEGGIENIREIPNSIKCNSCKKIFSTDDIRVESEEQVTAIELE